MRVEDVIENAEADRDMWRRQAHEQKERARKAEAEHDELRERADRLVGELYAAIDKLREQLAHKDHRWDEMRNQRDGLREQLVHERELLRQAWNERDLLSGALDTTVEERNDQNRRALAAEDELAELQHKLKRVQANYRTDVGFWRRLATQRGEALAERPCPFEEQTGGHRGDCPKCEGACEG